MICIFIDIYVTVKLGHVRTIKKKKDLLINHFLKHKSVMTIEIRMNYIE